MISTPSTPRPPSRGARGGRDEGRRTPFAATAALGAAIGAPVGVAARRGWVRERLFLGMDGRAYARSLLTPGNLVAAAILAVGVPVLVYRFAAGLGATTNLSQAQPWGLWIGFDMMCNIALAAGAFTLCAAVHLFGMHAYEPLVRPIVLTACLRYLAGEMGLLADLGKPWNIVMAIVYQGSTSALFEVAWCVMLYTTVLFLECLLPVSDWAGWRRTRAALGKATLALAVLSVVFSTMHQSALGSLFLIAPAKLHPLWYSPYIHIFFFVSAVAAGISVIVVESSLYRRFFPGRMSPSVDIDRLQVGLGKAGALVLFAYFFLKLQGVAEASHWRLLATGWGAWFLLEIVGFVLVPSLLFGYGARHRRAGFVRAAAALAIAGVVLNRLNVSLIAFDWTRGVRYVPSWMEVMMTLTFLTLGVLAFRWMVNRMPILSAEPALVGGERRLPATEPRLPEAPPEPPMERSTSCTTTIS